MTRSTAARGTVLALLLAAFNCQQVLAENVPRSIKEIVATALKRSAELSALEKEATARTSLAMQAGLYSNPTLELEGATGSLTGSPEERSFSIGINQELPLNGKLRLQREAGQRDAEIMQLQRDNAARLLKDEISTLAIELALAVKRQGLATELVKLNRDLVAIAGERFKAGDIPELDLNIAKVELYRAESRLLEVEREKAPLQIKLASLTGLDENDLHLSDKLSTPAISQSTKELVKQTLASRPDLQALALERKKADIETRLARAEAVPNPTAGFFVQWQRGLTEAGGMSSTSSDTLLGLRLSVPIAVFDRNRGGQAAARHRLDAAESRCLAQERVVLAEVDAAVSRLSSSERLLTLFEQEIIPQLTENLKLTQEAYRLGEVGIISVIEEQKKFFEVNDNYLSALHDRRLAFTRLETAVASELSGGMQ